MPGYSDARAVCLAQAPRRSAERRGRREGEGIRTLSAWMIVGSKVFSLHSVQNLTLADGLALLALSLIGLTAHELAEERAVHSLTLKSNGGEAEQEAPPTRMAA
jgi:hypothetical protein